MDAMKRAVIAAGLLSLLFVGLLSAPAIAAPQLFGREKKPQDKTRLLTGKVMDSGDTPCRMQLCI